MKPLMNREELIVLKVNTIVYGVSIIMLLMNLIICIMNSFLIINLIQFLVFGILLIALFTLENAETNKQKFVWTLAIILFILNIIIFINRC